MFSLSPKNTEYREVSRFLFWNTLEYLKKNKDLLLIPVIYVVFEIGILLVFAMLFYLAIFNNASPIYLAKLHVFTDPITIAAVIVPIIVLFSLLKNMTNATIMYAVTKRINKKSISVYEACCSVFPKVKNIFICMILRNIAFRQMVKAFGSWPGRDRKNFDSLSSMVNVEANNTGYYLFMIHNILFENSSPSQAISEVSEFFYQEQVKINAFHNYLSWVLRGLFCLLILPFAVLIVIIKYFPSILDNLFYLKFAFLFFIVYYLIYKFIMMISNLFNSIEWTIIYECLHNKIIPFGFFNPEQEKLISNIMARQQD